MIVNVINAEIPKIIEDNLYEKYRISFYPFERNLFGRFADSIQYDGIIFDTDFLYYKNNFIAQFTVAAEKIENCGEINLLEMIKDGLCDLFHHEYKNMGKKGRPVFDMPLQEILSNLKFLIKRIKIGHGEFFVFRAELKVR